MSTQYDIKGDEKVIDIIFDDVNNLGTCHLCGKGKTYKIVPFSLSKLNHVDRTRKDYATFVGLGLFSAFFLLAGRKSKILTRVPGEFHYDFVPLHLCLCKDCLEKKRNIFGNLKINKFDYKKHPLYCETKELGYKNLICMYKIKLEYLDDNPIGLRNAVFDELKKKNIFPYKKIRKDNYYINKNDGNFVTQNKNISFNEYGLDEHGYNREGFDIYGYDREGYNREGYNDKGFDRFGFNIEGYNLGGFDRDGYDKDGYNYMGYDCNGYDKNGFDRNGIHIDTMTNYDSNGWSREGINKDTLTLYNILGYDKNGYDKDGFDKDGFDVEGYNKKGFNKDLKFRNGKIYKIGDIGGMIGGLALISFIIFLILLLFTTEEDVRSFAGIGTGISLGITFIGYQIFSGVLLRKNNKNNIKSNNT